MVRDWYQDAFDVGYLNVYAHRDLAEAARAVASLTKLLRLKPSHRLLDLCCGPGRHLVFLRRVVGQSVGLDLSPVLLRRAQQHLWATSTVRGGERPSHLTRADMRSLPLADASFDRVVNLFTSFGYFHNEADNKAVLAEIARVLRSKTRSGRPGLLALDHINKTRMLATLKPETRRELPDGSVLEETRAWRPEINRVEKQVRHIYPDGRSHGWEESVRVYEPGELETMMAGAGLEPRSRHGDYEGQGWSEDAPRLILIAARRP